MLHIGEGGSTNNARVMKMAAWRRQMVETGAGLIETLDVGANQSNAIVLISHGLGSLHSMEEIAEGLSARFPGRRVVAFSRLGRGASPWPAGPATPDPLAHEALVVLPALMTALGLASADIVAHSDGVAVAMQFACTHPWMVDRIVAIAPQVCADREFVARTEELLEDEALWHAEIDRLCAEHADLALALRCWSKTRRRLAANPDLVLDCLGSLTSPLLLIQGLKDEYGARSQMEALSDRIHGPMKWVILRQDGHYPQHDKAEIVLDLICGHLEEPLASIGARYMRAQGTV